MVERSFTRREVLPVLGSVVLTPNLRSLAALADADPPAALTRESARPKITDGVQSGDVNGGDAVIWARTDRPARMFVDVSTKESMEDARTARGPLATPESDFTAKTILTDLPRGEKIHYRVRFQDLRSSRIWSVGEEGTFKTPALEKRNVRFAWSGDTAGQGFGINLERGGMVTYAAMSSFEPDFFIHSGDIVYADGPIQAEVKLDDGSIWKNVCTPEKSKVAETLHEFRGNFRYNLLDTNVRRFNASTAQYMQLDDHEVHNNWDPDKILNDARYTERDVNILVARAGQAFREYTPTRPDSLDPERLYSSFSYGPSLDVFRIDLRNYRGQNSFASQRFGGEGAAILGAQQLAWLKESLLSSKATWKVIASDMSIGLIIPDGEEGSDGIGNKNGVPFGREKEIAELLKFIKQHDIKNIVWLTADVHYAAALFYDAERAQFRDFNSFWEFVSGPLNAGTFGPNLCDNTFGPQVRYQSVKEGMKQNRPPTEGMQYFGIVDIDGKSEVMTVSLYNAEKQKLYYIDLVPAR